MKTIFLIATLLFTQNVFAQQLPPFSQCDQGSYPGECTKPPLPSCEGTWDPGCLANANAVWDQCTSDAYDRANAGFSALCDSFNACDSAALDEYHECQGQNPMLACTEQYKNDLKECDASFNATKAMLDAQFESECAFCQALYIQALAACCN